MGQSVPYFVDVVVPEAVLLPPQPVVKALVHPNEHGAVWYCADRASVTTNDDGAVQDWAPQKGLGVVAVPVKPNLGNLRCADDGGLQFERAINAGLVLNDALIDPTRFSCAIRYSSEFGDARTLITINPADHDTYLFLSEKDGHISWQDQQDQAMISVPAPKSGGWIAVGFDAGKLSLAVAVEGEVFSKPTVHEGAKAEIAVAFTGANDLFIGCRSHRKGILKTLGVSCVYDLLLWIDEDVCRRNQRALNDACRYCENESTPNDI